MPSNCYNFTICLQILFISIILAQINNSYSTCTQTHCNISQCVNPTNCLNGITDDECNCCKVCLRLIGETCGKDIGKCVNGLECINSEIIDPVLTNLVITGEEVGITGEEVGVTGEEVGITREEVGICRVLNCTGVKCNDVSAVNGLSDNIKCQNDSYKLLSNGSNSCCALS